MSEFWQGVLVCLSVQVLFALAVLWVAARRAPVIEDDSSEWGI